MSWIRQEETPAICLCKHFHRNIEVFRLYDLHIDTKLVRKFLSNYRFSFLSLCFVVEFYSININVNFFIEGNFLRDFFVGFCKSLQSIVTTSQSCFPGFLKPHSKDDLATIWMPSRFLFWNILKKIYTLRILLYKWVLIKSSLRKNMYSHVLHSKSYYKQGERTGKTYFRTLKTFFSRPCLFLKSWKWRETKKMTMEYRVPYLDTKKIKNQTCSSQETA